jgi:hypothetical protein
MNNTPADVWGAFNRAYGSRMHPIPLARAWANAILDEVCPVRPRVDPFSIARALAVRVERVEGMAAEGALVRAPGGESVIRIPASAGVVAPAVRRRQRFTIAHELGHHVLAENLRLGAVANRSAAVDVLEERMCNVFAEHLLMPDRWVRSDLAKYNLTPLTVRQLADDYDISLTALLTRICTLFYRSKLAAILFRHNNGIWSAEWATPSEYRSAVVPYSKQSCVARAESSRDEVEGLDTFYVDGRRRRLRNISMRLSDSQILTIAAPRHRMDLLKCASRSTRSEVPLPPVSEVQLPLFREASITPQLDRWERAWKSRRSKQRSPNP